MRESEISEETWENLTLTIMRIRRGHLQNVANPDSINPLYGLPWNPFTRMEAAQALKKVERQIRGLERKIKRRNKV